MISFLCAILALVAGYLLYGRFVDRVFGCDNRPTPAVTMNDGVDYVEMPTWKVFLIQLLNIAGTGPIFGALSGAVFGPVVYLWIVLGCIFAGGVHDYMCGMLSMRNGGAGISELAGRYLGNGMKQIMRVFSVILLVMCGVVFTTGPAGLLNLLVDNSVSVSVFLVLILLYYFVATFIPIDKVIGRIYPLFGICLIVMAVGVGGSLVFSGKFTMPELWNNFSNHHAEGIPIWPFMFITVACGAISGFHATQTPLMARCCKSERSGRRIFYGAMVAEGVIALVWAAAGVSCYESSRALLEAGAGSSAVVYAISQSAMGRFGSILAVIGVIICPISSGDTAYRAARITLADWLRLDQVSIKNRLLLTIPLLGAGAVICQFDYSVVWRYFSWSNQTLAMIALWAASVYFIQRKETKYKNAWLITTIPAVFMSGVSITYFVAAPECLGYLWNALKISQEVYYSIAVIVGGIGACLFLAAFLRYRSKK